MKMCLFLALMTACCFGSCAKKDGKVAMNCADCKCGPSSSCMCGPGCKCTPGASGASGASGCCCTKPKA